MIWLLGVGVASLSGCGADPFDPGSGGGGSAGATAGELPLALVHVDPVAADDPAWRERLRVRSQSAGLLLIELDEEGRQELAARRLGYTVVAPASDGAYAVTTEAHAAGGRVLFRAGERLLVELDDAAAAQHACHQVHPVAATPLPPARIDGAAFTRSERTALAAAPEISALVAAVDGGKLDQTVSDLAAMGNRRASTAQGAQAASYLKGKFEAAGYSGVTVSQLTGADAQLSGNVIAQLQGKTRPADIVVVGAHYDSIAGQANNVAPGADDNASGSAGLLEAARVLAQSSFEATVVFVAFGAEELGLRGSAAYASAEAAAGKNIVGMVNLDMIGHLAPGDAVNLDIVSNQASTALKNLVMETTGSYVPGLQYIESTLPATASSDHASFWQAGFPAVLLTEDIAPINEYIHTTGDTVGTSYNNPALARDITAVTVATVASLAVPLAAAGEPGGTPGTGTGPGNTGGGAGSSDPGGASAAPRVTGGCHAAAAGAVPAGWWLLFAGLALLRRTRRRG
jgi:Zn-dependent M28 family amino/carboxypeptidase